MQALCALLFLLAASPDDRVRSLDPWAADALRLGSERSQTFRELIAQLEESDVIVYVETRTLLLRRAAGSTRLAAATASRRYVRVVLSRDSLMFDRVAVLAHELQHAVEIARSEVKDDGAMQALFNTIGRPSDSDWTAYETEAAIEAGRVVRSELFDDAHNAKRARGPM